MTKRACRPGAPRRTALGVLGFAALIVVCLNRQTTSAPLRSPPAAASYEAPVPGETYLWRPVAIGGGGFITGLGTDASGAVRVARADVYGAYIWIAQKDRWLQLVNTDSMPAGLRVQDGGNEGVFEVVVAPSDPDRIYMAFKGMVYRSDNQGRKFVAVPPMAAPNQLSFDANSAWRHYGPVMAVGPTRPDLVLFGSPNDGLWRSEDAGQHWERIESIPYKSIPSDPGARPGMPVWFEPCRDGAAAERIWVMAQDAGMFVSSDDGRSFTPLSVRDDVQPRSLRQGAFTKNHTFLGVDDTGKTVWRFRHGAWNDLAAATGLERLPYAALAIDPATSEVYLFDEGGTAFRSSDDGDSWTSLAHRARAGQDDPRWLAVSDQSYFATGQVSFDPAVAHRLWIAAGTGVYYADLTPGATEITWTSQARGIEELVANDVIQPLGRAPLFAAWDFGIHVKPDLNAFSSTYGPKERVLIAAQQLDTTPSDPDFIVTNASDTRTCCAEDGDAVLAGFSRDAGASWTRFRVLPQPPGTAPDDPWRMSFGTIAVSANDSCNIVWEPSYNRAPFYTRDCGASWRRVEFAGERLPNTGSHGVYSYARKTLAADRVLPGVFYLVHSGEAGNAALAGLWRTDNGGANWRKVFAGDIAPSSRYSAKLRVVPGHGGQMFFTAGVPDGPDMALRRSADGGASWHALANVQRVDDVAFGKAARGASYPTIFISGQVDGEYGIWRSVDEARSWQRVAGFPIGSLDQVTVLGADPDVFGRVYVGYKGSGWRYGEPAPCSASPYAFPADAECFRVQ
jgi:photosystem II stability/assembly factor-like uncharacterized protein